MKKPSDSQAKKYHPMTFISGDSVRITFEEAVFGCAEIEMVLKDECETAIILMN